MMYCSGQFFYSFAAVGINTFIQLLHEKLRNFVLVLSSILLQRDFMNKILDIGNLYSMLI